MVWHLSRPSWTVPLIRLVLLTTAVDMLEVMDRFWGEVTYGLYFGSKASELWIICGRQWQPTCLVDCNDVWRTGEDNMANNLGPLVLESWRRISHPEIYLSRDMEGDWKQSSLPSHSWCDCTQLSLPPKGVKDTVAQLQPLLTCIITLFCYMLLLCMLLLSMLLMLVKAPL